MTNYIALLRGINVSGHNKIKMADLKQLFLGLNFQNIRTYIQSGNVLFQSKEKSKTKIAVTISEAIKNKFGYDIKIVVITKNDIKTVFSSNPFLKNRTPDITKLCVTFLSNNPNTDGLDQLEEIANKSEDEFKINGKFVYLHCPSSFAKTKLTNNLFERKLKVDATSRNWKTITKLVELSNESFE